jgi:predicted RNA-binding protein with PIN domain
VLALLIVDGNNLLHADARYAAAARVDVETARRCLVDDIAVFASGAYEATVVFDGFGVAPWAPSGVCVMWSEGCEADAIVEGLAFEARRADRPCLVVTTDRATRDAVFGKGVETVSSATMLGHLDEARAEWESSVVSYDKVTVADHLSPELRARLATWARGEGAGPAVGDTGIGRISADDSRDRGGSGS